MPRQSFSTGSAYEPLLGCSRAIRSGNFLSISATAPVADDGKTTAAPNPYGQTKRCLAIIANVVEQAGFTLRDVVKTRIYFKSHADWEAIAKAHSEVFSEICPANAFIQVVGFASPEWHLEVEAECHRSSSGDTTAIRHLLAKFANSFDLKDWDGLGRCLSDSLFTDYSELRKTPAETMTRQRYVELRRDALQNLRTHHLAGNVEIESAGDRATAKLSMAIYRSRDDGTVLNTHCVYLLGLEHQAGGWTIDSVVQKVLFNDGDPAIHRGIKT